MAWTPMLLLLLTHCRGSLSQPVLTQPPSLSASLGATARLPCTLKSDVSAVNKTIFWFQQEPGSSPRYLLSYASSPSLGSGVPSRFSGSKDASANVGLLLVSGLQPEDEADFSGSKDASANAGLLLVLGLQPEDEADYYV
ncbi:PREDICTED: immunoglobulin iota chain [Myotis davidii]|uniref:immunoglobulin iota chain n=1 Tax=Myotis davidii TaxID=225400 RepID=UPI0002A8CDA7|nr:PREDICTED: immunoglobulin iota chain [Myotis davidii]ELK38434.1 Immunoglobulin iota chain [Myotis davidii]